MNTSATQAPIIDKSWEDYYYKHYCDSWWTISRMNMYYPIKQSTGNDSEYIYK